MRSEGTFRSSDGEHDIVFTRWLPGEGETMNPRAAIQIAHGICEHAGRYEAFAEALTARGFAVYCHDHLGHGRSAGSDDELGYFGPRDGWSYLVEDVRLMGGLVNEELPDETPLFLFGHSMGSFIARCGIARYGQNYRGAMICGTSGANPLTGVGIVLAGFIGRLRGGFYRSRLLYNMAFGPYNKRIPSPRTGYDWLTRDEAVVDRYAADRFCTYITTAAGFCDLFRLLRFASLPEWAGAVPQELPVLVLSGELDPVGEYGKGPAEVAGRLRAAGVRDVTLSLYRDDRHELVNELDRERVIEDIARWTETRL